MVVWEPNSVSVSVAVVTGSSIVQAASSYRKYLHFYDSCLLFRSSGEK